MCLYISLYQDQNELELENYFGSRKKFAYVYKILRKEDHEDFYRSPIYDFVWDFKIQKVYQVDRDPNPTEFELEVRQIREGLHVYTSLEAARDSLERLNTIVKFRVLKENIVAINNFQGEAVCRELEFVKVLEE
jgi:hypothetical protein